MKPELAGRDDAKVPPSSSHPPKQVSIFCFTCSEELAIGRDELDGQQVVTGKAIFALRVTGV